MNIKMGEGNDERKAGDWPSRPVGARPSYLATFLYILAFLLATTLLVNAFGPKLPWFGPVVKWLFDQSQTHFGLFCFAVLLAGGTFALIVAPVPELSLGGIKVRNPLHLTAADKVLQEHQQALEAWQQERTRLEAEAETLREQLGKMSLDMRTALDNSSFIQEALAAFEKQDLVVAGVYEAFNQTDDRFEDAFGYAMNLLAHSAMRLVNRQGRVYNCTIMSYDRVKDAGQVLGQVGNRPNDYRLRMNVGVAGWVVANEKPKIIADVTKSDLYVSVQGVNPPSLLCVPCFYRGRVVGVINVASMGVGAFCDRDIELIQLAVDHVEILMGLRELRLMTRRQGKADRFRDRFLFPEEPEGGDESGDS